jgi:two-component system, response regulator PdtaR
MARKRILIADDDRLILSTLAQGLREAGYQVLEAEDGRIAVELCVKLKPDLAVLDYRMPDLSGVEAARLIRERTEVPFLFLSAYNEREVVEDAAREGALGFLVKPVDVPKLVPSLESALARAEDIRQLRNSEYHLNQALSERRETSIAVGLLMERLGVTEEDAFTRLRIRSRKERRPVHEVAQYVVNAAEILNQDWGKPGEEPLPLPELPDEPPKSAKPTQPKQPRPPNDEKPDKPAKPRGSSPAGNRRPPSNRRRKKRSGNR